MAISTSDDAHFLMLATDLWTDVPTVIGICTTDTDAVSAVRSATRDVEPGTQRYTLEEWHGTVRQSSTTISDPYTIEVPRP